MLKRRAACSTFKFCKHKHRCIKYDSFTKFKLKLSRVLNNINVHLQTHNLIVWTQEKAPNSRQGSNLKPRLTQDNFQGQSKERPETIKANQKLVHQDKAFKPRDNTAVRTCI